jgi:hypothetical protein
MTTAFAFKHYDAVAAAARRLSAGAGDTAAPLDASDGDDLIAGAPVTPSDKTVTDFILAGAGRGLTGILEERGTAPPWMSKTANVMTNPTVTQAADFALTGMYSPGIEMPAVARQLANVGANLSPASLKAYSPGLWTYIEAFLKQQHAESTFATIPRRQRSADEEHALVWSAMLNWFGEFLSRR